jgi:hypothetical protein
VSKYHLNYFTLDIKPPDIDLNQSSLPQKLQDDRSVYKFEHSVFPTLGTYYVSEPFEKKGHFFKYFSSGEMFDLETINLIIHCIYCGMWQRKYYPL